LRDSQLSQLRQNTIGFVFQSFYLQPFLQLSDNIAVPAMFTAKKKNLMLKSDYCRKRLNKNYRI